MKQLTEYIQVTEGLKDSFVNIFKNFFSHGEVSSKKLVTIDVDPKVFGKFNRDTEYFKTSNKNYPKLVPSRDYLGDDIWELYHLELGEDKYGNEQEVFTYIGHADFGKDNHKFEVNKDYQEFVEKVIEKYK